jgi:Flp pilus assembly protein TadG
MKHPIRNRRNQHGNSVIEFALAFSVLWAAFSGVFQYGYSMYVYNGLQTSVANGAAFASRTNYCADRASDFTTQVQQMVVFGDPTLSSGTSAVPGLTVANVTVTTTPATFPQSITVAITNYAASALFSNFTFTNKPAVTMPYLGNYQPVGSGC